MKKFFSIELIIFLLFVNNLIGIGEKVPFALLHRLLPSNPIILEAGAHSGQDTAWISEFWPAGKIFAFEPNPDTYKLLLEVAKKYKNIAVECLAFSNKSGFLPFYVADGASSLLMPSKPFNDTYFHADIEHPIMVQATTIDEWAKNKGIDSIDFMWLDMEGNELNALKGCLSLLHKVKVIYTEVNLQRFWNDCAMYDDMVKWMNSQGFEKVWEDIVPSWHGNVLFVNKNL